MTSKPEREVDARLADWVDGRLSERERERFVAELRVNPQLRKDLEDYEKTVAAVRAALQAPVRPVQIADRVMTAIAAGNPRSSVGQRWRNRSFMWSLASAAALLLLALLVNTWSPAPKTDTTAALDAAKTEVKAEGEKRSASDDLRKQAEVGALAQDERAVREQLEKAAAEERAATQSTNPPAPAQPAPSTPAPPAREPAPAEGTDPAHVGAAVQEKPGVPVPKVQPASDPVAPAGDAGAKPAAAPAEQDLVTAGAWGEQLPVVVVRGGALAAESRLQDRQPVPPGPSTGGAGRQGPGADAPAAGAQGQSIGMRKAAATTELPQQLDDFFKRQMTVAAGADNAGGAWSSGGLQFTPLPDVATFATGTERRETEAKELGEALKERSRAGAGGKDGVAPVERGWLVEGSKEDLELVLRQLSVFASASGMQLTAGETRESTLQRKNAPEAAVPLSRDKADAERRALPRSRLVLRFSPQPR
ncbi:MAG TPA: hypothetical protein VFD82_15215 [Planctomycetota bacterium]|nr:hypothetical protein [Planctomycetota bacterium]